MLLDFGIDEIAILGQFTDDRIDLAEGQLWPTLPITADECGIRSAFAFGTA
jgi:hypothetical protein